MALPHAQALEVINVRPLGPRLSGNVSTSLLKTDQLQLMRLLLPAGQRLPEHHVPGEVTIQCLEGRVSVVTPGATIDLAAGELTLLPGAEPHSVLAHEDCSLLVTVLLSR